MRSTYKYRKLYVLVATPSLYDIMEVPVVVGGMFVRLWRGRQILCIS
jgi:hypothetical protein